MVIPSAQIQAIYRYPVKGLTPQKLERTALAAGATLPADRLYAIENGPSGFDPAAPKYFQKERFLMLMRNERLATLRTDYDEASHTLTIMTEGHVSARGDLRTVEGRLAIEAFFRRFMPDELRGPPKVLYGENHSFSDVSKKVLSIINLVSVAAVESAVGAAVNPLRFRGNLYVAGWPAWHEFDLLGKELSAGSAKTQSGQTHRALRGDQRRSRHRHPRPDAAAQPDAKLRPYRLRRVCGGGGGRRHRDRRYAYVGRVRRFNAARIRRKCRFRRGRLRRGRDVRVVHVEPGAGVPAARAAAAAIARGLCAQSYL